MKAQVMRSKDSGIAARAERHEGGRPGITRRRLNRTRSCPTSLVTSSRCVLLSILFILSLNILARFLNTDSEGEEDGANQDLSSMRRCKSAVIKTSTRQNVFLPLIGLVPAEKFKPGDLIGVNKDSYPILDALPTEYDSRVKATEVDEHPTETHTDIGGLDKQIEELAKSIVLSLHQAEKFKTLGIKPPKGVLMHGPPGTGKTLMGRACSAQTKACFLKLAAPSLVQMFIDDGAKMVRDAFELAKEKASTIIFIDELDAIWDEEV